jgi:hypothetical protein
MYKKVQNIFVSKELPGLAMIAERFLGPPGIGFSAIRAKLCPLPVFNSPVSQTPGVNFCSQWLTMLQ